MTVYSIYDEIADILAVTEPAKLLKIKASAEMQHRLEQLIEKSKMSGLSKTEKDELDHYIVLERLVRLAKIRARVRAKRA